MSTLKLDTLSNKAGTASVPSDTIVSGTAKAWVNFDGTGTVAIRRAFNVSSITDQGTGRYQVNFITEMTDANYSFIGMSGGTDNDQNVCIEATSNNTASTSSFYVVVRQQSTNSLEDSSYVCCAIFS